jgi:hypothetical protein
MKKKNLLVTLGIIVALLVLGLLLNNYWQSKRWKTIHGCISYENKNYEYNFAGKGSWQIIDDDMGCNTSYDTAQTWGLVNHKVSGKKRNIGQLSVLVSIVKPNSPDGNSFRYLTLPDRDIYVEIGRITGTIESQTFGITDGEWEKLKNSFQFK